jgi:hypothetical protein
MEGALDIAAALLLAGAGSAKLRVPGPAVAMLRRAWPRLSSGTLTVRCVGAGELVVGLLAIGLGSRGANLALAGWYAAFTVVTVRLVRRAPATPCGCFGGADGPVGIAHVVQNAICAGIAAVAVARPPGRLGGLLDHGALTATVGSAQAVLLAYLGFLSITALPALVAARRQLEAR